MVHPSVSERAKFDLDLEGGEEWEEHFQCIIASGKVECKRDKLTRKTGNVFIEYRCRGKPGGISVTKAEWWSIGIENENGDIETAILVSVPWLKDKCRKLLGTDKDVRGGDDNASKGILLKLDDFR